MALSGRPRRVERLFTYRGKTVGGYFFAPCKDGIVFGIHGSRQGDVHLVLLAKNGKISYHIADKTENETPERYPIGHQISARLLGKKLERMIKPWIRPRKYHSKRKAWVMKRKLEKSVVEVGQVSTRRGTLSVELIERIENPSNWHRVLIRNLLGKGRLALIEEGSSLKFVIPVDQKNMISISVAGYLRLQRFLQRVYGFDEYFDYLTSHTMYESGRR